MEFTQESMGSEFLYDFTSSQSQGVTLELQTPDTDSDEEFPVVPLSYLDTRRYLYTNGVGISDGTTKVQEITTTFDENSSMNINLKVCEPSIGGDSNLLLLATFSGDSTITRAGIRGKIECSDQSRTDVKMQLQLRTGNIATCSTVKKIYENHFFPRPACRVTYFDHAKSLHVIASDSFSLELNTSGHGTWTLSSCTVFLRVHSGHFPEVRFSGEDIVARRLTWK